MDDEYCGILCHAEGEEKQRERERERERERSEDPMYNIIIFILYIPSYPHARST